MFATVPSGGTYSDEENRARGKSRPGIHFTDGCGPGIDFQGFAPRARLRRASTSAQSACHRCRSASGSLARASASRMPARSASTFQCLSVGRDPGLERVRAGFEDLGPRRELGLQPAECLASEPCLRGVVGRRVVLSCAGYGQRRRRRRRCSGAGPRGRRRASGRLARASAQNRAAAARSLRVVAHLGHGQAFGVVVGAVVALQQGRKPIGQCRHPLGFRDPLRRRIAPAGPFAAQLVPPAKHRERPGVISLTPKDHAEVAVGLGVVGLEPDRLAVFGDGLVELPLISQGVAEVVVGRGVRRA